MIAAGSLFRLFLVSVLILSFSCKHVGQNPESRSPMTSSMNLSESNKKFYFEDASEAELLEDVVEIEDDFESELSPEDNKLVAEILEKSTIDLKYGARYDIPIEVNPQVIYFIRYFQTRGRRHFEKWLERGRTYIPYIRKILKENNMPEDLVFVSMIESGFSPSAYSRAGAVGPWQFMKSTAMSYGLKVNWWIDERRNLDKSTRAAIKYLKHLYEKFDDWYLAIASYNAGEGKISRAIKNYKSRNYWDLCKYRYIRLETKNYVPKMIAAALIVKNLGPYGFTDITYENFPEFQHVMIENPTDLFKIAKYTGIPYKKLKELNPELRRWCTPPDVTDYVIKLTSSSEKEMIASLPDKLKKDTTRFRRHIVRYGETLWKIAQKYGTSVAQIKRMNKIVNGNRLRIGQSLGIPVRAGYRNVLAKRRKIIRKSALSGVAQKKPAGALLAKSSSYIVKRGDTLWSIASRFRVSPASLSAYNPLLKKRKMAGIFPGDNIEIPPGETRKISLLPVAAVPVTHKVLAGENLTSIASKYTTTPSAIASLNDISEGSTIQPGDKLRVQPVYDLTTHLVKRGENLTNIARKYSTTISAIVEINNISETTVIHPGDVLKIMRDYSL